jgi:hypothetical protein
MHLRLFIALFWGSIYLCGFVKAQSYYRDQTKPSIYVAFVKSGSVEPLWQEEGRNRVWLALHNNTIWDLEIPVFGVSRAYGDCGLFFEVVPSMQSRIPTTIQKFAVQWPPAFERYRLSTGYQVYSFKSGKSIIFSVPWETLQDGYAIRIPYNYGWENRQDVAGRREPAHFIIFSADSIPESIRSSKPKQ